ncbi:MAG TPA: isoprenoid biosynthesis glyoxalase ElbB [Polyangiaceae bacterium]
MRNDVVGVLLAGCGRMDGSEIYETVLTLLFLKRTGLQVRCYAPDIYSDTVLDHRSGSPHNGERRSVLAEATRLVREKVEPLEAFSADDVGALVIPGGGGVLSVFSTFMQAGAAFDVLPDVERAILEVHDSSKVLAGMCIAPLILARALRDRRLRPKLAFGADRELNAIMESLGATPVLSAPDAVVVDDANRIVSTPAYMVESEMPNVACGIEKVAGEIARLIGDHRGTSSCS